MPLHLTKLLNDVFAPEQGERVLILVDRPTAVHEDCAEWKDRRAMAREWGEAFRGLGLVVVEAEFPATGANNADLPHQWCSEGCSVPAEKLLEAADIALAFTTFSATAPLASAVRKRAGTLRVASLPGVLKIMEETALAADYTEVARCANWLAPLLTRAIRADVVFSSGHRLSFDLRFRKGLADDGLCRRGKDFPLINLPGGEAFIVPYEGEKPEEPSLTRGEAPVQWEGKPVVLNIMENRIVQCHGEGADAAEACFAADPARRNVAELGIGCNRWARVRGVVLEDEKAGLHWAYGRSEHLGGTLGPEHFASPSNVIHKDIVYAQGCPYEAKTLTLHFADGTPSVLISEGALLHNQEFLT